VLSLSQRRSSGYTRSPALLDGGTMMASAARSEARRLGIDFMFYCWERHEMSM
jgi:hypothetical protein